MTYEDIIIPNWCSYPHPNNGLLGCWSLVYGLVTGKQYCSDCDHYKAVQEDSEHEKAVQENQRAVHAIVHEEDQG